MRFPVNYHEVEPQDEPLPRDAQGNIPTPTQDALLKELDDLRRLIDEARRAEQIWRQR
jgi:hypothetical protein